MTMPLPDWFDNRVQLSRDKTALILPDSGERVSYGELADRASMVAGGLASLGVGRGDRVAVIALNGLPIVELLFACASLGAILVPLNHRLTEAELLWIASDAEPMLLFYDPLFASKASAIASSTGARLVSLEPDGSSNPSYSDLLIRTSPSLPSDPPLPSDPWLILYTGGTTGRPKGAVLTHGSLLANAINTDLSWGLREDDIAPVFTPMFHTGGLNVFTLPLLLLGGALVVPKKFDPEQALRLIVEERVTLLFLVPTMFQMLADAPGFESADLSAIRWAISGGAPCPERLYEIYKGKVRVFKQGYGLTEFGPNNFATPDEWADRKRGSIGKPSLMMAARVVDPEGNDVPMGEVGELWLSGPAVCAGYWRNPEDSAQAYDGRFFHTGDLMRVDDDGFFYVVDRKNDLIITGGENVYPKEVEEVLYGHHSVSEAAIVSLPDPLWGERVVAVVALKPNAAATAEELADLCRSRLAGYKLPRQFEFWESLPKSAAGKIMRSEVRRLLAEGRLGTVPPGVQGIS